MAINVDTVYKTVLLILNKEQRGYITPDEFNRTATQVQLDIFEQYFDDLNQQLRVPQSDYDYSDRQMSIDEKLSPFKTEGDCTYNAGKFELPAIPVNAVRTIIYDGAIPTSTQFSFYKIGTPIFTPTNGLSTEIQRLSRGEFYNIERSPLTASTEDFPTYLYEGGEIIVRPTTITDGVSTSLLRAPRNITWGFNLGSVGQYIYTTDPTPDSGTPSQNFELNASEQVEVITRILFYSGVIIRDPQIIQVAAQEIQQNEINQKS